MKAMVIKRFRDKSTKEIHNIGTFYEGSEERIKELQSKSWLVESKKPISDDDRFLAKLEGTIDEIKNTVDGLKKSDFEKLIALEVKGKNRKSLVEFLKEQSRIAGLAEPPDGEGE